MTTIKEKMAKKMLEEKLDFLGLEDSLELKKSGCTIITRFNWIFDNEEVPSFNGDNLEEIKKEMIEINGCTVFEVGKLEEFEEFTESICPAPTYIDLIK